MNYKIYSFIDNKSFNFDSFYEFKIETYKPDEFIISKQKQKFSVHTNEIFQFLGAQNLNNPYFIFEEEKVNFLISPHIIKKIYFQIPNLKKIKFGLNFYLAIFLASLLLFYRNTLSTLDV